MKIAFYDPFVGSGIGGVETQIRELARLFSKSYEVHVITGSPSSLDKTIVELILKDGVKFHFFPFIGKTSKLNILIGKFLNIVIPFKRFKSTKIAFETGLVLSSSLQFFLSSFAHFLRNKYDVIYVSNSICSLISFLTRAPVVYYVGGSGWLPPFMMRRVKKFLICSEYAKNDFERLTGLSAKVIPYGIDFKKFRRKRADKKIVNELGLKGKTVLIAVGRLSKQKGFEYLIKALSEVKKKEKNFKLLLIGDGEEKKSLERLSKKMGLEEEIIFLGKVFHDKLPKYYHVADIFVLPSLYESFGIVFLEAMAAGLPIISTNVAAIPEVVDKKVGILVKPKNVNELAKAILTLVNDVKKRRKMGKEGMKLASKFDWSFIGKMIIKELKNIK
jgi:glycosyltransferase involved in cell wall biosynthesis